LARGRANAPPRPQQSAQKKISREELLATPHAFIAWLWRYTPDADVVSIYDPVRSIGG
jgi:hypothetical protein